MAKSPNTPNPFAVAADFLFPEGGARINKYVPHIPHPPQMEFLRTTALEALFGGSAGPGKTDALLMSALEFVDVPGYSAIIFRRVSPDLHGADGLVERSREWLTPQLGKYSFNAERMIWTFPSGATLRFGHMQYIEDRFKFQGHAYQYIGFDELTHFEEGQYRYLLSRLRKPSTGPLASVPLRMRAASNPGGVGHEWVKRRLVDRIPDTTDPEDTEERAKARVFIPARLRDNPSIDTESYIQSLSGLEPEERAQLLDGDWNARMPGDWYFYNLRTVEELGVKFEELLSSNRSIDSNVVRLHFDHLKSMPPPAGGRLQLGIDWGQSTHALLGWPLEGGGMFVAREYVSYGEEPGAKSLNMLKMNQWRLPWDRAFFDAAGVQALDVSTPIPSPTGWTTMGDLEAGDTVFSDTGQPTLVLDASPTYLNRDCFELVFDDGSTIVADGGHKWLTTDHVEAIRSQKRGTGLVGREVTREAHAARYGRTTARGATTKALLDPDCRSIKTTYELYDRFQSGGRSHYINAPSSLELDELDLPIDPYILGIWLGDGTSSDGSFTCFDPEIVEEVARRGNGVTPFSRQGRFNITGIRGSLVKLGILGSGKKSIPSQYLRSSTEQRRDLLRGLLDSDGACNMQGQISYTTTLPTLRDGFIELCASLGVKASYREHKATLDGVPKKLQYRFKFMAPFLAFHLPRKASRQVLTATKPTRRYIIGVRRVDSRPVKCIEVESPTHLFLCGERMVPTHNSQKTFNATAERKLGGARPTAKAIPFGAQAPRTARTAQKSYKGVSCAYIRRLARQADEGRPVQVLAISPKCPVLLRQMKALKNDPEDPVGSWLKEDDQHGPDALVALLATAAIRHRVAIEEEAKIASLKK